MTKPAAFSATYADWRLVKTRKTVQIVFEVPVEKADEAYQVVGGMPNNGEETWFAIARLNPKGVRQEEARSEDTPEVSPVVPPRPRKPFADHTLPQQAGILCADPVFRAWIRETHDTNGCKLDTAEDVAEWLRLELAVESRRDLRPDNVPGKLFMLLRESFFAWRSLAA